MSDEPDRITPNLGPQSDFLSTAADVAIYGGAAGGGKSYGLLMDVVRGVYKPGFNAVIFRRKRGNLSEIWGDAQDLYGEAFPEAEFLHSRPYRVRFPSGATLKLMHLHKEENKEDHKGAQYDFIGFDELTEFTQSQFSYLLTRNRTTNDGVTPWVRATTNPKKNSWVRQWVDPYIDDDGFPIEEKCGEIMHFTADDDGDIRWVSSDWSKKVEGSDSIIVRPTSFTFIAATLEDNPELLEKNPNYASQLHNQSRVVRMQLLRGNWDAEQRGGPFKHHSIQTKKREELPDLTGEVRYWDLADTEPHPDNPEPCHTAGLRVAVIERMWTVCMFDGDEEDEPCYFWEQGRRDGECPRCGRETLDSQTREVVIVTGADWFRLSGSKKRERMQRVARSDGTGVTIGVEQEPGATGKESARDYEEEVFGPEYHVVSDRPTGKKENRIASVTGHAEQGRLWVVDAPWSRDFIDALEALDPKDVADALAGGYRLAKEATVDATVHFF